MNGRDLTVPDDNIASGKQRKLVFQNTCDDISDKIRVLLPLGVLGAE
jgi:hypothetical protein